MIWQPLQPPEAEIALDRVLRSWLGTPYIIGQRLRGVGADCVQLVVGILDQLERRVVPSIVPRLPWNCAIHSVRAAFSTVRAIRTAFPSFVVRDDVVEPGDILIPRPTTNNRSAPRPGHVLIVSPRKNIALHTTCETAACWTSIHNLEILRTYRPRNKHLWM